MNQSTRNAEEQNLDKIYWMLEDWIDEIKRKLWRSSCRLGTTIEKKNDQKRVDEAHEILLELEELSLELFSESGLQEKTEKKLQEEGLLK